ncbi:hypothetical protein PtA15_9A388 [Puccinia triticina]|uniref:Uncharacterized protein n=1 Tax=Puccinia triticina TaxID=208348 RepID=A0ABY7CSN7_9BASI|nr:uncharacterized protein PtA15_9A388 [Puccinia triticina]WAQ88261.1 hypothetical protein PtA15_9A388 [Puccinia triticina]
MSKFGGVISDGKEPPLSFRRITTIAVVVAFAVLIRLLPEELFILLAKNLCEMCIYQFYSIQILLNVDDNNQRSNPGGEKNSDLDDRSPDIDPVIDMWDREFRQNHSAGIPGLQPNSGIGNQPEEQSQALTLAESPNTAIAFLVLKELERTQNSSEPRYGSNDPVGAPDEFEYSTVLKVRGRGSDYQAAFGKAILAKDHALFGHSRSFVEILEEDEENIKMPDDDKIQVQLNQIIQEQLQARHS